MLITLAKYIPAFTGSMLKFIIGPVVGASVGLSYWETYACTVGGMMTTVLLLSVVGKPAREGFNWLSGKIFSTKKRIFTPRNRQVVRIWRKYGMTGVAFLTPLLLSPPFGTIIAVSFGERRWKIVGYVFISALIWGAVLTGVVQWIGAAAFNAFLHGGK